MQSVPASAQPPRRRPRRAAHSAGAALRALPEELYAKIACHLPWRDRCAFGRAEPRLWPAIRGPQAAWQAGIATAFAVATAAAPSARLVALLRAFGPHAGVLPKLTVDVGVLARSDASLQPTAAALPPGVPPDEPFWPEAMQPYQFRGACLTASGPEGAAVRAGLEQLVCVLASTLTHLKLAAAGAVLDVDLPPLDGLAAATTLRLDLRLPYGQRVAIPSLPPTLDRLWLQMRGATRQASDQPGWPALARTPHTLTAHRIAERYPVTLRHLHLRLADADATVSTVGVMIGPAELQTLSLCATLLCQPAPPEESDRTLTALLRLLPRRLATLRLDVRPAGSTTWERAAAPIASDWPPLTSLALPRLDALGPALTRAMLATLPPTLQSLSLGQSKQDCPWPAALDELADVVPVQWPAGLRHLTLGPLPWRPGPGLWALGTALGPGLDAITLIGRPPPNPVLADVVRGLLARTQPTARIAWSAAQDSAS